MQALAVAAANQLSHLVRRVTSFDPRSNFEVTESQGWQKIVHRRD